MMGEPWWYWAVFALAVALVIGVPVADWWEHRQDDRDRETWERIKNGRRP